MPAPSDVLAAVHLVLQFGFIGITALLLLVTVINRSRVRCVTLSWLRGPLFGLPAWPAAFLGAMTILFVGARVAGQVFPVPMMFGYLVGGLFWLVAGILSSSVLVTRYGVIHNVNRTDRAVAWAQVVDYFEKEAGTDRRFVFFYLDAADLRRRFEVTVPAARCEAFRVLLDEQVDGRFDPDLENVVGKKALEG